MPIVTSSQGLNGQRPDVSVIIPTHNRILMLEEALASVASQEFDGLFEIIIVDDNSQDGTSETVTQKYPFVHLISLGKNVGPSAARNRALLEARGNYIAFLDSDDLWKTNYLKIQVSALEGKEQCFCVSDLIVWDTAKDRKRIRVQKPNLKRYTSPIHHLLVGSFIYTPSSVVFPRQVFDKIGLFDESIRVSEDTDLYIRCLMAGYYPNFTELPIAIQRKHDRGQLTEVRNFEIRKEIRFVRVNKLYPLIEKRFDIIPIRHIYAEIYADFANQYFNKNYFLHWLTLSIASAHNASPEYALSNMMNNVKALIYNVVRH